MKKLILFLFILPLLYLPACEPKALENPDPAFLNGTWEGPVIHSCEEKWQITFQDDKLFANHWLRTRHLDAGNNIMCSKLNGLFFWNYKLDTSKIYRWNFREVDINVDKQAYLDTVQSMPFDPIKNSYDYESYTFKRRGNVLCLIRGSGEKEIEFHKLKN